MRAEEIKGLMEAYSKVHGTPEVLNEEVVEISDEDLEGYDLIEMTLEEVEELSEQGGANDPRARRAKAARVAQQQQVKTALGQGKGLKLQGATPGSGSAGTGFGTQLGGRQGVVVKGAASGSTGQGRGKTSNFQRAANTVNVGGQTLYKAKKGKDIVYLQGKDKPQLFKPGQTKPAPSGGSTPPAKTAPAGGSTPSAAPRSGGSTSAAPKPAAAPVKQTGDKSKDMAAWAKANPTLANKKKTPNPLMKDMPGQNKAELDQIRGNAALNSISKSSNAAKIMKTSPIAKQSLDRSAASLEAKPAATPKPVAKPSFGTSSTSAMNKAADNLSGKGALAPKPAAATPTPEKKPQPKPVVESSVDLFDIIKGHLLDEGYAETEEGAMVIMVNMSEEWRESIIMELTGGKGHPGYKAGSKDHGDLEDHPAVKKGGVLTPRHGEHLGDLDDEDDEEDELENILKDRSRARREAVRKPLRDKVKAARKKMTKEGYAVTIEDIVKLLDENREHEREMRKAAARERAEEKKEKKEEGKKSAKAPGRLGKSAGSSYADYQEVSIKAHDKATKGKFIPGMVKNEGYQRDPEKGEEKEDKKYEKVRGEKTPMPPRGDKRREAFEKWYAKQMGG